MSYIDPADKDLLIKHSDSLIPGVVVGCVILGFFNRHPMILLNKFDNCDKWMLPASFVFKDENVDDTANRILRLQTAQDKVYLRQFYTFGQRYRATREELQAVMYAHQMPNVDDDHWMYGRILGVGYYAFIDTSKAKIRAVKGEQTKWFFLDEVPRLFADDNQILDKAMSTIRRQIDSVPVDYALLPKKFTMPQLQSIYENILGKKLDRRNFERKMMSKGYITQLDEYDTTSKTKAARLFTFDKDKYEDLQETFLPTSFVPISYSI